MEHDEVEIPAMCDFNRERAEEIARMYNVSRIFTDYHELLAMPDTNIIDICKPNLYHSEVAIAALKAKLAVLVGRVYHELHFLRINGIRFFAEYVFTYGDEEQPVPSDHSIRQEVCR